MYLNKKRNRQKREKCLLTKMKKAGNYYVQDCSNKSSSKSLRICRWLSQPLGWVVS